MQLRLDLAWLRVLVGVVGLIALVWRAAWAYAITQAFRPDFNPKSTPSSQELRPLTIIGCLGVLASLLGSGLAYAKTANGVWAPGVAAAVACGVALFVVFYDVWQLAGGCS